MNIVLIGMRGSGKSTIGKFLSKKMNRPLIDSDKEIEKTVSMNISEIIDKFGWGYFREKEKEEILRITNEYRDSVISTGGGVVINDINIKLLKQDGVVIFINSPVEILSKRIKDTSKRPSLTGKMPKEELAEVWKERKDMYFISADIVYNKAEVEITEKDANEILKLINSYDSDSNNRN